MELHYLTSSNLIISCVKWYFVGLSSGVFHNQYFPFLGQHGYTSPLVAVQFEKLEKHILVLVQCRLLGAANVDPEPVKFEILLD